MGKFTHKGKKNTNKHKANKNKSHPMFKRFKPKHKTRSKTPASNPNKRNFQKQHQKTQFHEKRQEKIERNDQNGSIEEVEEKSLEEGSTENQEPVEMKEKPQKAKQARKEENAEFGEDHFNENDFYFDEKDYVDEGENLDFGEEDYVESDEGSQEEEGEKEQAPEKILTEKEFKRIYAQATKGKPYALTKLVRIFSKLINPDLKHDFVEDENIMNSHKFYKKMVKIAVKTLPGMFNAKISSFKSPKDIPTSIKQLIKRFLTKYSLFVNNAEKSLIGFIFKYIHKTVDLVLLFKNSIPVFFKVSLKVWAERVGTTASDNAFNFVTALVEKNPLVLEEALKYSYMNFLNYCKAMNLSSFNNIQDLQRNIVSLLSSNYEQAYVILFRFIRKLCIQLRATINDKKKASIKNIYNWQFVNSLSLWTDCVLEYYHRKEADINLLAYPLIQIIIGTLRLNFVDSFFPLRLNLVALLNKISQKTKIFVPVSHYLLEILETTVFTKKFTDFSESNQDLFLQLKLKPELFKNYSIVKTLLEETSDRLLETVALASNSFTFPEFSTLVINRLRKASKSYIDKNFKTVIKELIEKIEKHSEIVEEKRKGMGISIKDISRLKEAEKELNQNNTIEEAVEKIRVKQKEFISSRVSQLKGEFIEV